MVRSDRRPRRRVRYLGRDPQAPAAGPDESSGSEGPVGARVEQGAADAPVERGAVRDKGAIMIFPLPSSMHAHWRRHEVLANNLANASTAGYKQDDLVVAGEPMTSSAAGWFARGAMPIGQHTVGQWTDYSQGLIRETGRPLDVAIDGGGFFVVQTSRGLRYTRAGALTANRDGTLTTPSGQPILGQGGPIAVTSDKVTISAKGEVLDDGRVVDTIRVVEFAKPYGLSKDGDGLFAPVDPAATPTDAREYQLVPGAVEGSNVDTIRTMVAMIEMLRSYESAHRAVQAADEVDRQAANDMGRI